jgi:hypothetical protein
MLACTWRRGLAAFGLLALSGCSGAASSSLPQSVHGLEPASSSIQTGPSVRVSPSDLVVPSTRDIDRFAAAIAGLTPEVHVPSHDLRWLIDSVPHFIVGTLISVRESDVHEGITLLLRCEANEGVPTGQDCPRTTRHRGVILVFDLAESRTLRAGARVPLGTVRTLEVEFARGLYTGPFDQERTDALIRETINSAPIGTRFALFVGPSNTGGSVVAGPTAWGRLDERSQIHAMKDRDGRSWLDSQPTVASILAEIQKAAAG